MNFLYIIYNTITVFYLCNMETTANSISEYNRILATINVTNEMLNKIKENAKYKKEYIQQEEKLCYDRILEVLLTSRNIQYRD